MDPTMTTVRPLQPPRPPSRREALRNLLRLSAYHDLLTTESPPADLLPSREQPGSAHPGQQVLTRTSLLYLRLQGLTTEASKARPALDHLIALFTQLALLAYPQSPPKEAWALLSATLAEQIPRVRPAPSLTTAYLRLLRSVHRLLDTPPTAIDPLFPLDIAVEAYTLADTTDLFRELSPPSSLGSRPTRRSASSRLEPLPASDPQAPP